MCENAGRNYRASREVALTRALFARFRSVVGGVTKGLRGSEDGPKAAQRTVEEKDQALNKLRQQLQAKNREISGLQTELARRTGEMPVFFIVGFAKSGTSWLMRTLNGHPEILCTGEGLLFGRGTDLDKRRGTVAPSSLYGVFADSEYLRAWLESSAWTRGDDPEEHITNLTHMSIDYFLGGRLARTRKRIVGDKTPFVSEEVIEEIARIYPDAKVVHIIRDGRDVAVSAVHHMWNYAVDAGGHLTVNPEEVETRDAYREDPQAFLASGKSIFREERLRNGFAQSWRDMTARTVEDGPRLLGENYAEVRYEDLLERPEEEVGRVLQFLGADAGQKAVSRAIESGSFERWTKGRGRGQEESGSFFRKGVAGDWENVFTGRDKEVFKEVAGDLLVRLGYEDGHDW